MPRFAANLTMMFNEVEFLARFDAAKTNGFDAVEFLFPYAHKAEVIAEKLEKNGQELALFNLPPGDWEAGDKGMAAIPGREQEFQDTVGVGLEYARVFGNKTVHMMAGILPGAVTVEKAFETYVTNYRYCADAFAEIGVTVIIEPLNTRDVPGYMISQNAGARAVIAAVDRPNTGLQFDFYHVQIMTGDLATRFELDLDITKHVQIAGVPERFEPNVGEINYPYLFALMDRLGYEGYVGCEYRPQNGTEAGLGWLDGLR
ncbi:MAG: hydroxypyruvate isomerase family protein [Rhodospirillales bacterium]|nr:hydroxypyruvate isomerase family protein [Rhodospirillales bacterium]